MSGNKCQGAGTSAKERQQAAEERERRRKSENKLQRSDKKLLGTGKWQRRNGTSCQGAKIRFRGTGKGSGGAGIGERAFTDYIFLT
ncbi:hypothetical protein Tco_0393393 [Tanacetum coccineum]